MTSSQLLILAIIAATLLLFLFGRWRHDLVAATALLATVIVGLVPADSAFSGFAHPAVITVACVLILSSALLHTGVVDLLAQRMLPTEAGPTITIAAFTTLAAALSSFMNNVGALALLMPMALQIAQRQGLPPGKVLMPLSFGTMLGGMTTLIGTPSNLIVSGFRNEMGLGHFSMFAFTPVGITVAVGGIIFIALIGWRLVPARQRSGADSFNTGAYMTEARVGAKSKASGMTLYEAEEALGDADAQILSLVRNEVRLTAPHPSSRLREGDVLLIEADPEALSSALDSLRLVFSEDKPREPSDDDDDNNEKEETEEAEEKQEEEDSTEADPAAASTPEPDEVDLVELVILPGSSLPGRTASDTNLRTRYGINLLAISRQGSRIHSRVRQTALRHGDVLLMQGSGDLIAEFASTAGCAPLAARAIRVPARQKMITAASIMLLAVALTAFDILPASISFSLGVLLVMVTRVLPLRKMYEAIDWPVIVMLGALLPVAQAMETTGAAQLLAVFMLNTLAQGNATIALIVVLLVTMTMTDVINNSAAAAIMCPIAIGTASQLGASADPFLMAVAIGASTAFLTPIGHQNNTLILGPGGFRFGDYWRMGLPLEIVVGAIAIGAILIVWPL